jgi:hypothetical protein
MRLALCLCLALVGCTKKVAVRTVQPNPMREAPSIETLRVSKQLVLDVGDLDLPQYKDRTQSTWAGVQKMKLRNTAYFAVVSKERIRFHVQIVHKWQEWADPNAWRVKLVDDRGRTYYPEAKDVWSNKTVTRMWDHEERSGIYNEYGDEIGTENDGHRRRVPLETVSVFHGKGDYTFKDRKLFAPDVKSLTLVMKKADMEYRFEWEFGEGAPPDLAGETADPMTNVP